MRENVSDTASTLLRIGVVLFIVFVVWQAIFQSLKIKPHALPIIHAWQFFACLLEWFVIVVSARMRKLKSSTGQ